MFKVIFAFTFASIITLGHCLKGDYTDNPPPSLIPYLPPEPNGNEDPPEVLTAVIAPAASAHESYYGQPNYEQRSPPYEARPPPYEARPPPAAPAPMPYLGPLRNSNENLPQYRDESPQPLYHSVPHIELPHSTSGPSYENNEINPESQASPPLGPPLAPPPPPPQELYVAANSPYDHTQPEHHEGHLPSHYEQVGGTGNDDDHSPKYHPYVPSIETSVPTSDGNIQNTDPSHHSHHPLYAPHGGGDSLIDHESHSHHSHEAIHPDHYSHHEDHHPAKNEHVVYSHHHPHHPHDEHHHSHHSHHSHKHSESSSYSHKSSDHPDAKSSIYHSQDVRVHKRTSES